MRRRSFIQLTASATSGLILGFALPYGCKPKDPKGEALRPNAFIELDPSGRIVVWSTVTEMGQGVRTLLITVAAEELDVSPGSVSVRIPSPGPDFPNMTTGGSSSSRVIFHHYRQHFANLRLLLLRAAAKRWDVGQIDCTTQSGRVINEITGQELSYGDLVSFALQMEVPTDAPLKAKSNFKRLGKNQAHFHNNEMLNGKAKYGIDFQLDGMVYCSIVRCPVLGGKIKNYDDSKARMVDGYLRTVAIEGTALNHFPDYVRAGIAVVAKSTWSAMKAARALEIDWDTSAFGQFGLSTYETELERLAKSDHGLDFRKEGNLPPYTTVTKELEAIYSGPYLSHSPMEPMNATAHIHNGRCEIWAPCHNQASALIGLKQVTGLKDHEITINTTLIGGSFGRRLEVDYIMEAALVAKSLEQPVKVTWSRTDDTKYGVYRSPYCQRMVGKVSSKGEIVSFEQHIACASVWKFREPDQLVDGIDYTVIMPAKILPYSIPHIHMTQRLADLPVPICWWRASYPTIQHTVQECWFDELAFAAKQDPLDLRIELLKDVKDLHFAWQDGWGEDTVSRKRLSNVLMKLKETSGWINPKPPNTGRGIACSVYGGTTYVGQVVEVSVVNKQLFIERITCVVDCGMVLNPDNVVAQMEGGIIFGLSAALYGNISFTNGQVDQSNFADYRILTMKEVPEIEVIIISSDESLGGVGEPGAHPIQAALCNAIFSASGVRIRHLPIKDQYAQ